jgi:4,5-DOPA dioxygenase extradiol
VLQNLSHCHLCLSFVLIAVMDSLKEFQKFTNTLSERHTTMPVLFTGHGSPMNGIEDNSFSASWEKLGTDLEVPSAVICISAHWLTRGTRITAMETPRTIHDFGGFPQELFNVQYPAPGNPDLAKEAASLIHKTEVGLDHEWGLDHGTWSVIRRMYPKANIPVLQLSIDYTKPPQFHYELARELEALRKKGVLIVGSGNMVHNLRIMDWSMPANGYDWAVEMNEKFKTLISSNDHKSLINFEGLGQAAKLSIPTSEHYLPLLYILGLKSEKDRVSFFNDNLTMGSISMTSVMLAG